MLLVSEFEDVRSYRLALHGRTIAVQEQR